MTDVARDAGVSLVTVSRAINTPDQVAPATLAAIQAAVDRLGYVPNLTAGSLASSRSRIVAAIVPTIANLVFSETMEALALRLAADGYQLLLGQSHYRPEAEAALVDAFLGRRVDGLVLTGCNQGAALRARLHGASVPVVQIWDLPSPGHANRAAIDMAVGFSNVDAGRAAARHLMARGHRVLGFIGADEDRSRQRLRGFRQQARQGVRAGPDAAPGGAVVLAEMPPPPASPDQAVDSLAAMLAQRPDLSAVFCNNDLLAISVLFECHRRGLQVPQQLAVLGFGDMRLAQTASPRLSTVRVQRARMGTLAGERMLARLQRSGPLPADAPTIDIGFEVVVREST